MQRKTKTSIAILTITAITLAFITPTFLIKRASPLGKWIDVGIYCEDTEDPVPDGLAVRLVGQGYDITQRTKNGHVLFGSGLVDGTFTVSWFWNEPYSYDITIDCSEITWQFDYYVPNPTITKHFKYDTPYGPVPYPPVVGLEVSLYKDDVLVVALKTDKTGTVVFNGTYIVVCKDYYLKWTWGGEPYSVGPIHFAYDTNGALPVCAWKETNYLEPKSWWRQK